MASEAPMSDVFFEKLARIVETNLEKENFGVKELVQEIGLSRSQVHRRLKSICGQSISQFIRGIRLMRSHELLEDEFGSVSEIAYKVGFHSPTYFNKCFQEHFGYAPGSVKKLKTRNLNIPLDPNNRTFFVALLSVGLFMAMILLYLNFWKRTSNQNLDNVESNLTLAASKNTIAILPFKDDSEARDNAYFCDAMMDEILDHLQKISGLNVKSRTAVEPYKNSGLSFSKIAQELGVAFVLEGSVRKYGDHFRVSTQLIEVASGNHLWSESYDGILSDTLFVIQSGIARKVASSLNAVITPDESERIDRIPTTDIEAYDLRIRASHEQQLFWETREVKHLKLARDLLDRALIIDPNYKRAILGKGEVFVGENNFDSALIYADRLIVLYRDFIRGYGLKGDCYFFKGNHDLAIENYLKAIDLIPNSDDQWTWYHIALGRAYLGKNDVVHALPHIKMGLEMGIDYLPTVYFTMAIGYLQVGSTKRPRNI